MVRKIESVSVKKITILDIRIVLLAQHFFLHESEMSSMISPGREVLHLLWVVGTQGILLKASLFLKKEWVDASRSLFYAHTQTYLIPVYLQIYRLEVGSDSEEAIVVSINKTESYIPPKNASSSELEFRVS